LKYLKRKQNNLKRIKFKRPLEELFYLFYNNRFIDSSIHRKNQKCSEKNENSLIKHKIISRFENFVQRKK